MQHFLRPQARFASRVRASVAATATAAAKPLPITAIGREKSIDAARSAATFPLFFSQLLGRGCAEGARVGTWPAQFPR
jgi:hypothetical protein